VLQALQARLPGSGTGQHGTALATTTANGGGQRACRGGTTLQCSAARPSRPRPVYKVKPFYGYRKVAHELSDLGVTRKQVRRIMRRAGLRAIYPGKRTSISIKNHKKYPYLLRGKVIQFPNQVWATDITYIKLKTGFVYLVAIIDLFSRCILSWRLSNTMDTDFCISALQESIDFFGVPAIFNTDQGSEFTSEAFVDVLKSYDIEISMDGVNRALDNVYIERFWRTLKYEDIFLKDYDSMTDLKEGIKRYV
jgi:putative transposase